MLAQFFFQNRLTDPGALSALRDELAQCRRLNLAAQTFMRAWSSFSEKKNPAVMLDQTSLPWFAELNRSLNGTLDDAQFRARIRASTVQLGVLATEMPERACAEHPVLDGSALRTLLGSSRPAVRGEPALLADFA